MSSPSDNVLNAFPWMTYGRRETRAELAEKCRQQSERVPLMTATPLVSLVIAVPSQPPSHPDGEDLEIALSALKLQSYPHWEALVVSSESCRFACDDKRIRFVAARPGASEADLKNLGAKEAHGDWLGFLEPDAVLSPAALFLLLDISNLRASDRQAEPCGEKKADLLYANHVELDETEEAVAALVSKPELSRVSLTHFNYIGKPWIVRAEAFHSLQGFSPAAGAAHEHDFLLRLIEGARTFAHVPAYLYYRRFGRADAAPSLRSIEAHLERTGVAASVSIESRGSEELVKLKPKLEDHEAWRISAVVCFRDRAEMTVRALDALALQVGKTPVEVILVDNQSSAKESAKVKAWVDSKKLPARIVPYDAPFNFARMHEVALEHASGRLVLLLNNDVFLSGRKILDEMAAWARLDWVGTVGILLRYENGKIQHGGMRARFGTNGRTVRLVPEQEENRFTFQTREVFVNTFAACLVKREVLGSVGLRPLDLPNGFGDVAFHFDCARRGLKHLMLGHLEGIHLESASRSERYEYWEEVIVERDYPEMLEKMLRRDLAILKPSGVSVLVPELLKGTLAETLREQAPWLDPLRPAVKSILRTLSKWRGAEA